MAALDHQPSQSQHFVVGPLSPGVSIQIFFQTHCVKIPSGGVDVLEAQVTPPVISVHPRATFLDSNGYDEDCQIRRQIFLRSFQNLELN
ncbi:hypothetical protein PPTG_23862 [Phytophthora nicotianae INRA-310]|uniref:Uncharacterized protein n=1 Tax=Phytophthora nicotianae (strain INRA-310) TaxID=761204 RepID=W2PPW9_PHYN3|nr:hypothetical protein PPTG_23862 [Phytophthora nicotianae INRA-310]ETN02917.1 hypothetical protein PPTG_23862 [Phytophthora nicotianae INRA-310]